MNPNSKRSAIVADEGDSVWLYLTNPREMSIAADCWLANTGTALGREELRASADSYRARDVPLPAPREVLDIGAHSGKEVLNAASISFRWTPDGEGIAVLINGAITACIPPDMRRGSNRQLIVDGPWGSPLDSDVARKMFGD